MFVKDEFHGIVMSIREYKDVDAIIKVFTLEFGKQMFFVKNLNSGTHHLKSVLQPCTKATFIGQINQNGLSFLTDYKDKQSLWKQFDDIYVQAYLAYFIAMCDAVVDDRIVSSGVFTLFSDIIDLVHKELDIEIISFLFELKMLSFWGVDFPLDKCQVSNQNNGPFDISLKYSGVIAQDYWDKDNYRLHIDPNAVYIMNQMKKIPLSKVGQLSLSQHIKDDIQKALDTIYDELVGIKLKSKQYIQQLKEWYNE